jgi:DNA polymerase-3 subunit delta'
VRGWLSTDEVKSALDRADVAAGSDARARLAAGAPGRLLASASTASAAESARRLLEVAASGDRARALRVALAQGASGARGAFSDVLEALTVALHDRARAAVRAADERTARNAARAVALVEECKLMAGGNVNPQLITASLLESLTRTLSA